MPAPWVDDLFPFPTPAVFRTVMDMAWEEEHPPPGLRRPRHTLRDILTDCMFGFTVFPSRPDNDPPEEFERVMGYYAPPEFVTFGDLGFDLIRVGYVMPAPELKWPDYPVAQKAPGEDAVIQLGADTRSGLEFLMSRTLRWFRDEPGWSPDAVERGQAMIRRLADALGVHPDPDRGEDTRQLCTFEVPGGWRHEKSDDGIGVLAPESAFADRDPVVADWDEPLEPVLADAAALLDAGYPASALVGLKDTFHYNALKFEVLKPLWARAYRDLGRSELAEALDICERRWSP